jgi:hypothetical protein
VVKEGCSAARNVCTGGDNGLVNWHDKGLKDVVKNTLCGMFVSSVCCCKLVRDGTCAVEGKLHDGDSGQRSGALFANSSGKNDCPGANVGCTGRGLWCSASVNGTCDCKVCVHYKHQVRW